MQKLHDKCLSIVILSSTWAIILFSSALLARGSKLGQQRMRQTHLLPPATPEAVHKIPRQFSWSGLRRWKYLDFYPEQDQHVEPRRRKRQKNSSFYGDTHKDVFISDMRTRSARSSVSGKSFVDLETAVNNLKAWEILSFSFSKDPSRFSNKRMHKVIEQKYNDNFMRLRSDWKKTKTQENFFGSSKFVNFPVKVHHEKHLFKRPSKCRSAYQNQLALEEKKLQRGKARKSLYKIRHKANRMRSKRNAKVIEQSKSKEGHVKSFSKKQPLLTHKDSQEITTPPILESYPPRETNKNRRHGTKFNSRAQNKWAKLSRLTNNVLNWKPNFGKLTGYSRKLRSAGKQGREPSDSPERSITSLRKSTNGVTKNDLGSRLATLDRLDLTLVKRLLRGTAILQGRLINVQDRLETADEIQDILEHLIEDAPFLFQRDGFKGHEEKYSEKETDKNRPHQLLYIDKNFPDNEKMISDESIKSLISEMSSSELWNTELKRSTIDDSSHNDNRLKSIKGNYSYKAVNVTSNISLSRNVAMGNSTFKMIPKNSDRDFDKTKVRDNINIINSRIPNDDITTTKINSTASTPSATIKNIRINKSNSTSNPTFSRGVPLNALYSQSEDLHKTIENADIFPTKDEGITSTLNILADFEPVHLAIEETKPINFDSELTQNLFPSEKTSYKISTISINLSDNASNDDVGTSQMDATNQFFLSRMKRSTVENSSEIEDVISANISDIEEDVETYYDGEDSMPMYKSHLIPIHYVFLLPFQQFRMFGLPKVFGALELSLYQIKDRDLLPGYEPLFNVRDSRCSISEAMNEAISVYDHKLVDVFIGPVCDYAVAPIARQIRYWQKPLITPGALAGAFGEEATFPFLIRVGANFHSTAEMMVSIMDQFEWKRIKIIYDPNGLNSIMDRYCFVASDTIVKTIRTDPNKVQDYQGFYSVTDFFDEMSAEIGNEWARRPPLQHDYHG